MSFVTELINGWQQLKLIDKLLSFVLPSIYCIGPMILQHFLNKREILFFSSRVQTGNKIYCLFRNNGFLDLIKSDLVKPIQIFIHGSYNIKAINCLKEPIDSNLDVSQYPNSFLLNFDFFRHKDYCILEILLKKNKGEKKTYHSISSNIKIVNGTFKDSYEEDLNSNLYFGIHSWTDFFILIFRFIVSLSLILLLFSFAFGFFTFIFTSDIMVNYKTGVSQLDTILDISGYCLRVLVPLAIFSTYNLIYKHLVHKFIINRIKIFHHIINHKQYFK